MRRRDTYNELISRTDVQALQTIVRSDNPIMALGVTKRELSWTRFMAWLMDPIDRGDDVASCFVASMLNLLEGKTDYDHVDVVRIEAEVVRQEAGRIDLLVEMRTRDGALILVVENKIDSTEGEDQLKRYVKSMRDETGFRKRIIPLLIELGDGAVGWTSCPDAICWGCRDVEHWLRRGQEKCRDNGISFPTIVTHYLSVFKAWDLAKSIRTECREAIDRVEGMETPPMEWVRLRDWIVKGDIPFFDEVLSDAHLKRVLDQHGFSRPVVHGRMRSNNEFLKLTKSEWTLRISPEDDVGINIHFESKGRGQLHLHAETEPYYPSIAKKPALLEAMRPQLAMKAKLHRLLRDTMDRVEGITLDKRGLRQADAISTGTAAKFITSLGDDCEASEFAHAIADIVERVSPVVDQVCDKVAKGTGCKM